MINTRKKIVITFLFVLALVLVTVIAVALLGKYSKPYNEMLDKKKYEQLSKEVIASNIEKITAAKPNEDINYITDFSALDGMAYVESAWNNKTTEWEYRIGVFCKDDPSEIVFSSSGTIRFLVAYKNRIFIVNMPNLLSSAKSATEGE